MKKIFQYEITLKKEVNPEDFKKQFLSPDPPQIEGKKLSIIESRCMKDRTIKEVTKVLLFEAPIQLPDEYIYNVLSQYGDLYSNEVTHYKYRGTDIYNGVRSMTFKEITKPIPTVLFVRGNKIKTRHEDQDRSPICSICKEKGHYRDTCPDLQAVQDYVNQDKTDDDPNPPEVRTWAAARRFVQERKKKQEEEAKKKEFQRKEEERLKKLEEAEQHRREMLMRRNRGALVGYRPDTESSEESETGMETKSYRSEDEGFKEVKRRDRKKRKQERQLRRETAKKGRVIRPSTSTRSPESLNIPDQYTTDKQQISTEIEISTPTMTPMNPEDDMNIQTTTQTNQDDETTTEIPQTPDFNDQLQRRMRDQEEEDHIPESSLSPQSSPYHPDIGESNGTVLGSEPPEEDTVEEDDETEQESPTKQSQTISPSYPQPGQLNQPTFTELPEATPDYSDVLQSPRAPSWQNRYRWQNRRLRGSCHSKMMASNILLTIVISFDIYRNLKYDINNPKEDCKFKNFLNQNFIYTVLIAIWCFSEQFLQSFKIVNHSKYEGPQC